MKNLDFAPFDMGVFKPAPTKGTGAQLNSSRMAVKNALNEAGRRARNIPPAEDITEFPKPNSECAGEVQLQRVGHRYAVVASLDHWKFAHYWTGEHRKFSKCKPKLYSLPEAQRAIVRNFPQAAVNQVSQVEKPIWEPKSKKEK